MNTPDTLNPNYLPPDLIIRSLIDKGWTQFDIAIEVDTTQSVISRLQRGICRQPTYILVDRLRALYQSIEDFAEE